MSNNGYNADNFKRNAKQDNQDGDDTEPANEKVQEYTKELLAEKLKLESTSFPHCLRLLDQEIENSRNMSKPPKDNKYADLYHDKLVKVDVKVLIPVKDHPKFNFVGKLLGPKGNNMKKLKDETMCKISVFGKGSIRDKQKEDELRNSLDPKYAHLSDELHVGISALAPPAEAYARIAYALAEVRKYLVPDMNDPMQDQMYGGAGQPPPYRMPPPPMGRGPVGPPPPRGPGGHPRGGPGGPGGRKGPGGNANVLSILDRARASMEESYGFNEYDAPPRHLLDDPYTPYYDESGQSGDYYNDAPVPAAGGFYGGGQAGGSRPSFKGPRAAAGGPQGGGGRQQGGRPFNRPAPYNRPGK